MMATPLTLPRVDPSAIERNESLRPETVAPLAGAGCREEDREPLFGAARPALRVAATIGAIALSAYAVVFIVAVFALLGGP